MLPRRHPTCEDEQRLLDLLERERAVMIPKARLGRYTGIADYLLREAEFFELPDADAKRRVMVPGYCFGNAYRCVRPRGA